MNSVLLFYTAIYIGTIGILTRLAMWCQNNLDERAIPELRNFLVSVGIWTTLVLSQFYITDPQLLTISQYAVITATHSSWVVWVFFVDEHTGNKHHPYYMKAALFAGIIFTIATLTNFQHQMVIGDVYLVQDPFPHAEFERRWGFYTTYLLGYGFLIYSLYKWAMVGLESSEIANSQTALLITGTLAGVVTHVMSFLGLAFTDVTPLGALVFGVIVFFTISKHKLFEVGNISYPTVFNQIDEGLIILDQKGRVSTINDAAEPYIDPDVDDIIGEPATEVLPSPLNDHPAIKGDLDTVSVDEIKLENDEGELTTYQLDAAEIKFGNDDQTGVAVILNDISRLVKQREMLEEQQTELQQQNNTLEEQQRELEIQKEELERQNERLDRFAGTVTHDLRNPVNTARIYTEMAKETGEDEHFETINESLDRMEDIIEDVLALAREGRTVNERQDTQLNVIAENAWDTITAPDASMVIDATNTVAADPERLQTLFENLFRNSVEHVGEDVSIRVGDLDDDHGWYVSDDGPGIPEEKRDEVFEHGHTTNENGTGFGLSIVSEVVDAHGWDVCVTDGEDGGARFEIRVDEDDE